MFINRKFFAVIAMVMAVLFTSVACNADLFGAKEPTGVDITFESGKYTSGNVVEYSSLNAVQGKILTFSATVKLKGGETNNDVTWRVLRWNDKVSTDAVAGGKVSVVGQATGKNFSFYINSPGTYEVIASSNANAEIKASAKIAVGGSIESIGLIMDGSASEIGSTLSMYVKDTVILRPSYHPADTTQKNIDWSMDTNSYFSMTKLADGSGVAITGLAPGSAKITATSSDNTNISKSITVKVSMSGDEQSYAASVLTVSPSPTSIEIGKSVDLTADITDEHGNPYSQGSVTFTSSNTAAVSVTALSGRAARLTAVGNGTATIKAQYSNDSSIWKSFPVTVTGAVESLGLSSSTYRMVKGESITTAITFNPTNATQKNVQITSSDASIAKASLSGSAIVITAVNTGTARITVTSTSNPRATVTATVVVQEALSPADRVQRVEINPGSYSFSAPSGSTRLTSIQYTRNDSGNVTSAPASCTWSIVSGGDIISGMVNGTEYIVTPKKPGTAVVRATSPLNTGVYAEATITVGGELKTLIPSADSITLTEGESTELDVTVYPASAVFEMPIVTVDNGAVAEGTLKKTGSGLLKLNVTGKGVGKARLSILVEGREFATVNATVQAPAPVKVRSIELSSSSVTLKQDADPLAIIATSYDADGAEIEDAEYTFEFIGNGSSNVGMTIAGNVAILTPKNAGVATLLVTSKDNRNVSATCRIEVGGSAVQGEALRTIRMPYDAVTIGKGGKITVAARTIPAGLTPNLIWSTSDNSIASVDGVKLDATVTGQNEGTATITATDPATGKYASLKVNVVRDTTESDTRIAKTVISGGECFRETSSSSSTLTLTASALMADGTEISGEEFRWYVDSPSGNVRLVSPADGADRTATIRWNGFDNTSPSVVTAVPVRNPNAASQFVLYVSDGQTYASRIIPSSLSITLEKGAETLVPYKLRDVSPITANSPNAGITATVFGTAVKIVATESGKVTLMGSNGETAEIIVNVVDKAEKVDTTIASVVLDREYLSYDIAKKALQTITAKVVRTDGSSNAGDAVEWKSSDETIISITQNNTTTATVKHTGKLGTATITATSVSNPNAKASCYVEVIDSTAMSEKLRAVSLSSSAVTLDVGRSTTLTASVTPASLNGQYAFKWTSSTPNVVSVENGKITAIAPGTATINVTAVGTTYGDSCRVTVPSPSSSTPKASRIDLSTTSLSLSQENMDKAGMITARVIDTTGAEMTDARVKWSWVDNGIADITTSGNDLRAYPASSGSMTVTASYKGLVAYAVITTGAKATSGSTGARGLVLSSGSVKLSTGGSMKITAYTIPGGLDKKIEWHSSSPEIIDVAGDSKNTATLTALKAGTVTISAYLADDPNIRATMTATASASVKNEVTEVRLDRTSILLDMNEKASMTVGATAYINGVASANQKITWSLEGITSESLGVSTLDTYGQRVSLVKKAVGEGWLVAKASNGLSARCYVEIVDTTGQEVPLQRIALDQRSATVEVGETRILKATAIPDTATDTSISWSTSDSSVATVTKDGRVTGVGEGRAEITAYNVRYNIQAVCEITVPAPVTNTATPASVTLSETYIQLRQDASEPKMLSATVVGSDGRVMSDAKVDWTVTVDGVVTFDRIGNTLWLSPKDTGRTVITATCGNATGSCLVVTGTKETASTETIEKLLVIPSSAVVEIGKTQPVIAGPYPSGIGILPFWTTSDASKVGLIKTETSNAVYAKGVALGNAKVVATDTISSKSAESLITVMDGETIKNEVTSIILDRTSITLDLAEKNLVSVKAYVYVNGSVVNDRVIDWEYIPETGASDAIRFYTDTNFRQTASVEKNAVGTGWLKATTDGSQMFAQVYIKVIDSTDAPTQLGGIRLSNSSMSMLVGSEAQLTARVLPDGATATVRWNSTDEDVVTVFDGRLTAVGEGKAVIRAYAEEKPAVFDECVVTVEKARVIQAGSVELSSAIVRLTLEGENGEITATVRDTEGNVMPSANVWWDLSDENADKIAEYSQKGNVLEIKPLNAGTTTVRAYTYNASYERKEAEATIIIGAPAADRLTGLSFNTSEPVYMVAGDESKTIGVVYSPDRPTLYGVVWSGTSQAFTYSTTASTATLTPVAVGEGTLTATSTKNPEGENISASIRAVVVATKDDLPDVTALKISRNALSFDLADKALTSITATAYGPEGNVVTGKTVTWSVEQNGTSLDIIETQNGTLEIGKGSSTGTAKITAECEGIKATCLVTVIDSTVAGTVFQGIALTSNDVTMALGSTAYAELEAYPASMATTPSWSVIDGQDVITVSRTSDDMIAIVRAVKAGTAVLQASMEVKGVTYTASCTYNVTETANVTLAKIELDPSWAELKKPGDIMTIKAILTGTDGNEYPGQVKFAYSDPAGIINITPSGGNRVTVEALATGTAWLKATCGSMEAKACITVGEVAEDRLTALTVTPSKLTMKIGQAREIAVAGIPETALPSTLEVRTSDPEVATGTYADGILTINGVGAGNAYVSVSSGSITATVTVSVAGMATPSYMKVNPAIISLTQEGGDRAPVAAEVYDVDGYRLVTAPFGGVTWTSDDDGVARLSSDTGDSNTVLPVSYGHAVITAECGDVSATASVSVADAGHVSGATSPSSIALDTGKASMHVGDRLDVNVLFAPTTLAEEYKGIVWKTSSSRVATVEGGTSGKATVTAVAEGSARITATSVEDPALSSTLDISVVGDDVEIQSISLDRRQLRLDLGKSSEINATLLINGVPVADGIKLSQIAWSIDGEGSTWGENPTEGEAPSLKSLGDGSVMVTAGSKAGYCYITAKYGEAEAKVQLEVYDAAAEGEKLRGVVLSQHSATLQKDEYLDVSASIIPEVSGVSYAWSVSLPEGTPEGTKVIEVGPATIYKNWIRAHKSGTATLHVTATSENGISVSDTMEVRVVDSLSSIGKYSSIKVTPATITINNGSTAIVSGTLLMQDKSEGDEQLSWRIYNNEGAMIYDSADPSVTGEGVITPYGTGIVGRRSFEVKAIKPGYAYVEAYFSENLGSSTGGEPLVNTVASRAFIEVTGDARKATLSSSVYHLAIGEQVQVTAQVAPETASFTGTWKLEEILDEGGTKDVTSTMISYPDDTKATLTAKSASGNYRLTYTATDTLGQTVSATASVQLHDSSYGKSGVSYISFASPVVGQAYPWAETSYPIYVHYIDGSVKTLTPDLLGEAFTGAMTFSATAVGKDGTEVEFTQSDNTTAMAEGKGVWLDTEGSMSVLAAGDDMWRTYVERDRYAVSVLPVKIESGADLVFRCRVMIDGQEFGCAMTLSADRSNLRLSLSSTGISLYTGGSAMLTATATIDDAEVPATFTIEKTEEKTNKGELVEERYGTSGSMNDKSAGTSVFSRLGTDAGLTIGTKTVVRDKEVSVATEENVIKWDDVLSPDLIASFPRTAKWKVTATYGGMTASEYVDVTVNLLPDGYTYPQEITLSTTKMTLTPPFNSEQTISASVTDLNGKKVDAVIDWYYSPVTDAPFVEGNKLDNDHYEVLGTADNGLLETYMQPDGSTVYFKPLKEGVYRMTAKVRQNPQLSATAVFNVLGKVTGITADCGNSLVVTKGSWADISAVYTPVENLARDMFWAIGTPQENNTYSWYLMKNGNYNGNPYINFKANGTTGSVYGKLATSPTTQPEIFLLYAVDSEGQGKIEKHLSGDASKTGSHEIVSIDGSVLTLEDGNTVTVYSHSVTVDIEATKTIYSFSVEGTMEVDPEAISGSGLTYTVNASSSNNSQSSFTDWDWVEAKLVGSETGMIYASSVPVDADGRSLYQVNERYYLASQLVRSPEGIYSVANDPVTGKPYVGYAASDVKFYNATAGKRYVIELDSGSFPEEEISFRMNADGTKCEGVDGAGNSYVGTMYEIFSDAQSEYVIREGLKYVITNNSPTAWPSGKAKVCTVVFDSPLSNWEKGRMMVSNGGKTYNFSLNKKGIPTEPLVFKTGVSEQILDAGVKDVYFDSQLEGFKDSDQLLYVGGKLISINPGESTIRNGGGTSISSETVTDSTIQINEGGSATLRLRFNPSYTHQTAVKWVIMEGAGIRDDNGDNSFSITPGDSVCVLNANKIPSTAVDKKIKVVLRAMSTIDPTIYCDFTVVINCVVKNIEFAARALSWVNKNDKTSVPIYAELSPADYPVQHADNRANCYDYADVAGESGSVDGFYIEMLPTPNYGYEFRAELIDGADIGSIDTTNIDSKDNAFRFIPHGRIYSSYDSTGKPDGSYSVNYGTATVRVSCDALCYSKDFAIDYKGAGGRVVRWIDQDLADNVRGRTKSAGPQYSLSDLPWDVYKSAGADGNTYIYGMEQIVLNVGEKFPVTMIEFNKGEQQTQGMFKYPTDEEWLSNMFWYVTDASGKVLKIQYDKAEQCNKDVLTVSEKVPENSLMTPEKIGIALYPGKKMTSDYEPWHSDYVGKQLTEKGIAGKMATVEFQEQGIYYLNYSLVTAVTYKDDYGDTHPVVDVNGVGVYAVTRGSIPIYVISEAEQTMLAAIQAAYPNTFNSIKNVSKANMDKWLLPTLSMVYDDTGAPKGNMVRGLVIPAFDNDKGFSMSPSRTFTGLKSVGNDENKIPEDIDFTKASNSALNTIATYEVNNTDFATNFSDSVTVSYRTSLNSDTETKTFKKLDFSQIRLTGPNGLAKLNPSDDKKRTYVIGPYRDENTHQVESCEGWTITNRESQKVNGFNFYFYVLRFNAVSADSITFKNINDTSNHQVISLSLPMGLNEFIGENWTLPTTNIYTGGNWADENSVKTLSTLRLINIKTTKDFTLKNFPNLNKFEYSGATGNLEINGIGSESSGIEKDEKEEIIGAIKSSGSAAIDVNISNVWSNDGITVNLPVEDSTNEGGVANLTLSNITLGKGNLSVFAPKANVTINGCTTTKEYSINVYGGTAANTTLSITNVGTKAINVYGEDFNKTNTDAGFTTVNINGDKNVTVYGIQIDSNSKKTEEITIDGVQIAEESKNVKNVNVKSLSGLESLTIMNMPYVNLDASGTGSTENGTLKISHCGTDQVPVWINPGKFKTAVIGSDDGDTYIEDITTFASQEELEINNVDSQQSIIVAPVATSVTVQGSDTKLSALVLHGEKNTPNTITLNYKGGNIGTLDMSLRTIDDISVETSRTDAGIYYVNLNEATVDAKTLDNAMKTISNSDNSEGVTARGATVNSTNGTINLGSGSQTTWKIEASNLKKISGYGTVESLQLNETLYVGTKKLSDDEINELINKNHTYNCSITVRTVEAVKYGNKTGVINSKFCTEGECLDFEIQGKKYHRHYLPKKPSKKYIIVEYSSSTPSIDGYKYYNLVTNRRDSGYGDIGFEEAFIPYTGRQTLTLTDDGKAVPIGGYTTIFDEEGNESQTGVYGYHWNFSPRSSTASVGPHIGSEYNPNHDPLDLLDGCLILVSFPSGLIVPTLVCHTDNQKDDDFNGGGIITDPGMKGNYYEMLAAGSCICDHSLDSLKANKYEAEVVQDNTIVDSQTYYYVTRTVDYGQGTKVADIAAQTRFKEDDADHIDMSINPLAQFTAKALVYVKEKTQIETQVTVNTNNFTKGDYNCPKIDMTGATLKNTSSPNSGVTLAIATGNSLKEINVSNCTGLDNLYIKAENLNALYVSNNPNIGKNTLWVNDWGYSNGAWNSPYKWRRDANNPRTYMKDGSKFEAKNSGLYYWIVRTGARGQKGLVIDETVEFGSNINGSDIIMKYLLKGWCGMWGTYTRYDAKFQVNKKDIFSSYSKHKIHYNEPLTLEGDVCRNDIKIDPNLKTFSASVYLNAYVYAEIRKSCSASNELWIYPFGQ